MSAGTGGKVIPTGGWRNRGTAIAISATPTSNTQVSYSFAGWAGSGASSYSGTNNPASITMTGPITETASFTQNAQVTVQTNPTGHTFSVDGTDYSSTQTFSWRPVQATPLPQRRRRTVPPAFVTSGRIGALAELFRTLLLPLPTRLIQRISTLNIFSR